MIESEQRDDVRVLRLAHGKANAIDLELLEALSSELEDARSDDGSAALVVTGSGSIFSAGVDLFRVLEEDETYLDGFLHAFHRTFLDLFTFPRPVVAAINGHAIAGGCVLACACDRRIAADAELSIGLPELRVGVPLPAVALEIVRATARPDRLTTILYGGETVSPSEAMAWGLLDEIVAGPGLLDRSVEVTRETAAHPAAFAATKTALRGPYAEAIRDRGIEDVVLEAWNHPETRSAIRSWLERTLGRSDREQAR